MLLSFRQRELENSLGLERGLGNCTAQFPPIYCGNWGQGVDVTSGFPKHSSLSQGRAAREGIFKAGTFLVIHALTS